MIDWQHFNEDPGFGMPFDDSYRPSFHSGVVFADRFFVVGAQDDGQYNEIPAIWSSRNGLTWELASLPDLRDISDLIAGSTGLVALGDPTDENTSLWLTENGHDWERIVDTDFQDQRISAIGATADGFVAFGTLIWTSADGRDWQTATTESGLSLAVAGVQKIVGYGDQLIALAGGAQSTGGPLEVWSSTNLVDWTKVAQLPHSQKVHFPAAAAGPLGWIVTGYDDRLERIDYMWLSADGQAWQQVAQPVGPVNDVFVDDVGYVAVGFVSTGQGCAISPSEIQGLTWTSVDGHTWTEMPLEGFQFRRIDHLLRNGRTLIGIGVDYGEEDYQAVLGSVWTAKLPPIPPAAPAPTPTPTPSPEPSTGCGGD